jgi:hypothetical protein
LSENKQLHDPLASALILNDIMERTLEYSVDPIRYQSILSRGFYIVANLLCHDSIPCERVSPFIDDIVAAFGIIAETYLTFPSQSGLIVLSDENADLVIKVFLD